MALARSELPQAAYDAIASSPEEAEAIAYRDKKRHRVANASRRFF